jgi:hypothetical protein
MLKPVYSETIDALRMAYSQFYWLRWFFPANIAAAITAGLPPIELEQGKSTPYTCSQAIVIIRAFKEANWLSKLLFNCLRAFEISSLLRDYDNNKSNLSFLKHGPDRISHLPDERFQSNASGIGAFLTTREKAALDGTSRQFHGIFKPELKKAKFQKLLEYVVRGEQDKAEAILRTEPGLLIERGDVTDYSDRTFHNVSPWECMLWAMDTRYMGQMMLACIPPGEAGDVIRRQLVAQYDAMQGGGSDLVRLGRAVSPIDMPFDELEKHFGNEDAVIFWRSQLYYAKKGSPPAVLIAPTQRDAFERLKTSFHNIHINKARKSTPEEHDLIAATTHHTLALGRKGIRYEQPATYKSLVKLGGTANPGDIGFTEIASLFDTPDALLFWNNQFYYANKTDSTVTMIIPTFSQPTTQIVAFDALKVSLTSMGENTARLPDTLEEHQLINTLFAEHPAFKATQHCNCHYDFGVIDALRIYIHHYLELDRPERATSWIKVAKKQREMPAHLVHHYCDPDVTFYSLPDFKAATFKRSGRFSSNISNNTNLFSPPGFDSAFGFQFGLWRRGWSRARGGAYVEDGALWRNGLASDWFALRTLYETRTDDTDQLREDLRHSLAPAVANPLVASGPR